VVGKVRIRFKINVIEDACLVARAIQLMTHSEFAEGYNLIKDMQGSEFLTALRMLAGREVMVKKLSDFKERHKTKPSESIGGIAGASGRRGRPGGSIIARCRRLGNAGLRTNRLEAGATWLLRAMSQQHTPAMPERLRTSSPGPA